MAVVRADTLAGAGFDQHAVTVRDQFARAFGRQADAIFVILDFLRGADDHASLSEPFSAATDSRGGPRKYNAHRPSTHQIRTTGVHVAFTSSATYPFIQFHRARIPHSQKWRRG